jgi:LemA protein
MVLVDAGGVGMGIGLTAICGVVVLLVGLILAFWAVSIYNGLVLLKNNIRKSWSNIDVLLKQRSSEIPNLVEAVKGYMKHEKGVLEAVTKARTEFMNAQTVAEKAKADGMLAGALKTLFAVAESYPQLRATENFQQLQSRISAIESQIADRREFYNDSVNTYNIKIKQIPDMFVAGILGYGSEPFFKVSEEERADIKVKF